MRKINTRGIESANKVMLMAAIAYNLKKVINHQKRHRTRVLMSSVNTISCYIDAFLWLLQGTVRNKQLITISLINEI